LVPSQIDRFVGLLVGPAEAADVGLRTGCWPRQQEAAAGTRGDRTAFVGLGLIEAGIEGLHAIDEALQGVLRGIGVHHRHDAERDRQQQLRQSGHGVGNRSAVAARSAQIIAWILKRR